MLLIYPNQVTSLQGQMGKQAFMEALLFQWKLLDAQFSACGGFFY